MNRPYGKIAAALFAWVVLAVETQAQDVADAAGDPDAAPAAPEVVEEGVAKAVESVAESARTTIAARQLKRDAPRYPTALAMRGREAWVYVTYCIDESGRPQNVAVTDSVGNREFENAAVEAVGRWQFEPALLEGQPVWQSNNETYVIFAIAQDERGATRPFVRKWRSMGEALDEGRTEQAREQFFDAYQGSRLNLYELSMLWVIGVRLALADDDVHQLERALQRATASDGRYIDKETYEYLLKLRAEVELAIGKWTEAIRSYQQLIDSAGERHEYVLALAPKIDLVRSAIAGDQVLQIQGQIRSTDDCETCSDSWTFRPPRNRISFTNVDGVLTTVDMRCDRKRFESAISELTQWTIPESWGQCQVRVFGEPGTTFDVVMMPDNET